MNAEILVLVILVIAQSIVAIKLVSMNTNQKNTIDKILEPKNQWPVRQPVNTKPGSLDIEKVISLFFETMENNREFRKKIMGMLYKFDTTLDEKEENEKKSHQG